MVRKAQINKDALHGEECFVRNGHCSCSALRKEDGSYAPAHLLYDIRMERSGRNSICEDVRSAPTGMKKHQCFLLTADHR